LGTAVNGICYNGNTFCSIISGLFYDFIGKRLHYTRGTISRQSRSLKTIKKKYSQVYELIDYMGGSDIFLPRSA